MPEFTNRAVEEEEELQQDFIIALGISLIYNNSTTDLYLLIYTPWNV
jgi:hypothetical protein